MLAPTQAQSQFDIYRSRIKLLLVALFAFGAIMTLIGISESISRLATGAWDLSSVFYFMLGSIGILLVTTTAVIIWLYSRQERPRPLRPQTTIGIGLLAPVLSNTVLAAVMLPQIVGIVELLRLLILTVMTSAILTLQLSTGALEPDQRQHKFLTMVWVSAIGFVAVVLALVLQTVPSPSKGPLLLAMGIAVGLFVVYGGMFYLFGYLLVRRPRYHHIP